MGTRMSRSMLAGMVAVGSAGALWLARNLSRRHTDEPATIRDEVDEAIADSFPASDPPSFAGSRGGS